MSSLRFRKYAALLILPFALLTAAPVGAGDVPPKPPPDGLVEGPWPPRAVLTTDPALVSAPLTTAAVSAAAACPAAPYGVKRTAPGSGKTVALTFDDGPNANTLAILSILQRYGVAATFFNIGVNSAVRPADVRSQATVAVAIGNHTWDHPRMTTLSASAQAAEMDRATAQQVALVGRAPCLYRPPYGEYNATSLSLAQQRRMTVWTWSVDTEDWKAGTSTSSYWVERIVSRAKAGASQQHPVVLMHNPAATVLALPRIIEFYRSQGYTFVDLLGTKGHGMPGPAAVVTNGGMHLFFRGTNGSLYERTRSNGSFDGATSLAGVMVGGPAAVATATASTVYVTGKDAHVWQRTVQDNGSTSTWQTLGGQATSKPGAAIGPNGLPTIVVRGSDSAAWMRQRTAGGWSSWQSLGGVLNTAPSLTATPVGLTVGVVGSDNALWVRGQSGGTWSSWRRIGGAISADVALAAVPGGKVLVVVRGSDNAGWFNLISVDGTSAQGWQSIAGRLGSGPTVAVDGAAAHVFAYGSDGRIWEKVAANASTASGWSAWRVAL